MSLQGMAVAAVAMFSQVQAYSSRESNLSPKLRAHLAESESYEKVIVTDQEPQINLKSYIFDIQRSFDLFGYSDGTNDLGFDKWEATGLKPIGIEGSFMTDIYASYQSPAFWVYRLGHNWLIWNPNLFVEASANIEFTINLALIQLIFKLNLVGFKYTPLAYTLSIDLDPMTKDVEGRKNPDGTQETETFIRNCQSLSWFREVFDIELFFEYNLDECSIGALGALVDWFPTVSPMDKIEALQSQNFYECDWNRYSPQLPIYQYTLFDQGDQGSDYSPYKCNDYSELEPVSDLDANGNISGKPVGGQNGDQWEFEPTNPVFPDSEP